MKLIHFNLKFFLLILFLSFLPYCQAYAYLDPGTGSYLLQILIAAFIGFLYSIKLFWLRIKLFFGNLFHSEKQDDFTKEE